MGKLPFISIFSRSAATTWTYIYASVVWRWRYGLMVYIFRGASHSFEFIWKLTIATKFETNQNYKFPIWLNVKVYMYNKQSKGSFEFL